MRPRHLFLVLLVLISVSVDAGPRRRAVGKPAHFDESTPGGWLATHAYALSTPQFVPYTTDLQPLRTMIGSASIVALGDATHGTHEFYTLKLRLIDFLVREMDFDVVALEAPFPAMNRIDAYVQGGVGDAHALVRELMPLGYFFWDAEELVAVIEGLREYNAHRGERRPVRIAGFDVFEPYAASQAVIAYLRGVDPPAAVAAEEEYGCVRSDTLVISGACVAAATRVRDALAASERAGAAFDDALHCARVVVQNGKPTGGNRDDSMAANTLWLREHRGAARKMILWAHNTHVSKAGNEWAGDHPMGKTLAATLHDDYYVLATLTAAGTFRQWDAANRRHVIASFPPLAPNSYESYIRERGVPNLLIPLRGTLPAWLTTTAAYNSAAGSGKPGLVESLPEHYDAAIFLDTTTPLTALP
jgi:erythromycin esterase